MRAFLKMSFTSVIFALGILSVSAEVFAVDVYKCKDAHGKLNYTDSPCVGSNKTVSYSKLTEHHYKQQQEAIKAERVAAVRRNTALRPVVNTFAVNEKYDNQVRNARFNSPRTSEQAVLNKNLDKIEKNRQRELKGM